MKKNLSDDINVKELATETIEKAQEKLAYEISCNRKRFLSYFSDIKLKNMVGEIRDFGCVATKFDFAFILYRIKQDLSIDNDIDSLKIKVDISNQLSKLKTAPSVSTECHIETNNWFRVTSLKRLMLKNIFRKNKYVLIFHKNKAEYDEEKYRDTFNFKKVWNYALIITFILSVKLNCFALAAMSLLFMIATLFFIELVKD